MRFLVKNGRFTPVSEQNHPIFDDLLPYLSSFFRFSVLRRPTTASFCEFLLIVGVRNAVFIVFRSLSVDETQFFPFFDDSAHGIRSFFRFLMKPWTVLAPDAHFYKKRWQVLLPDAHFYKKRWQVLLPDAHFCKKRWQVLLPDAYFYKKRWQVSAPDAPHSMSA